MAELCRFNLKAPLVLCSDADPLLCSGADTSGVSCPALDLLVHESEGTAGEGPIEGYEDDGGLEHLSWERLRELGLFSLWMTKRGSYPCVKISEGWVSRGQGQTLASGAQ